MKDGLIIGMAVGLIAGALLTKNSPEVKKMVEKGEEQVKKLLANKKS